MKKLKIKNTYDLKISGKPSLRLDSIDKPQGVASLPSLIPHIKPKALVKEGDTVQIGSPLFIDKNQPEISFLAPGAGTVSKITYGPRRRLDEIVITLDKDEASVSLPSLSDAEVKTASREKVVETINATGTWNLLRQYPFKNIPKLDATTRAIYVTIDNDEPFLPHADVFLKDNEALFKYGIKLLEALSDTVYVGVSAKNTSARKTLGNVITHEIQGDYPANSPSVFIYYTKQSEADNDAWFINAQDLLLMAKSVKEGQYTVERTVVVAGALAKNRTHLKTRLGVPFSALLEGFEPKEEARYIAGGVLTGRKADATSYLGLNETALHLLPENKDLEIMSFMKLGANKASFSNTFLSRLFPGKAIAMNSNLNGGYRACVACNACPEVCPVEIQPQFLLRDLTSNDYEGAMERGLLDCADCGLCSYVCPSKIDLSDMFDNAKNKLAKEVL